MKCQIEGYGLFNVNWYKDNIKLDSSGHHNFNDNDLIINNPSGNDNGTYNCIVRSGRKIVNSDIDIFVTDQNETENLNNLPALSSRINCIDWYADSEHPNGALIKLNKIGQIIFRHSHESRKEILCRTKRDGAQKKEATMVDVGNPIVLNCNINNIDRNTELKINWNKDGKYFRHFNTIFNKDYSSDDESFNNHSRIVLNPRNGSLIIKSTIASDGGSYECSIYDDALRLSSHKVKLEITEMLKFAPRPTSKHIEMGQIAKIHCKVQGTPTPSVRWIKVIYIISSSGLRGTFHA